MSINILRYSLLGIAGGQEVDHTFVKFIIYPLTMIAFEPGLFSRWQCGEPGFSCQAFVFELFTISSFLYNFFQRLSLNH